MIFAVLSAVLDFLEESYRDFKRLRRKRKLNGKKSLTRFLLYFVVVFKPGYLRLWDTISMTI